MTTSDVVHADPAPAVATSPATRWRAWITLLRPRQWLKNLFILAPVLFSNQLFDLDAVSSAFAALVSFCAAASGVYFLNDVLDREADRAHPVKRHRPVAALLISPAQAGIASVLLMLAGVAGALGVGTRVAALVIVYVLLNLAYSTVLKRLVIVDVFTIAAFFIIRLLAGSAAVGVVPSIWLLLCGGLLALFLAFTKRRHELVLLQDTSTTHRAVLSQYSTAFLDQLSVVLLAITVVAYVMYTLDSPTARQVGSDALAYSTVFVLYGVIRYLFLVHRGVGGDPAESLLTDRGLLVSVVLWAAYCALVIYQPF
jgi:4-hydroxybenzoate polyprenyltransferase